MGGRTVSFVVTQHVPTHIQQQFQHIQVPQELIVSSATDQSLSRGNGNKRELHRRPL